MYVVTGILELCDAPLRARVYGGVAWRCPRMNRWLCAGLKNHLRRVPSKEGNSFSPRILSPSRFISFFHTTASFALPIHGDKVIRIDDDRKNRGGRRFGTSGTQAGMSASVGSYTSVPKPIPEVLTPDSPLSTPHHLGANASDRSGYFSTQGFRCHPRYLRLCRIRRLTSLKRVETRAPQHISFIQSRQNVIIVA